MIWLCNFLIFLFVCSTTSELYTNVIVTSSGLLQGTTTYFDNSWVDQYLGIPYAEPPVGQLRFRKPLPVKTWNGIKTAYIPGPACVQYVDYPFPWYDMYGNKSEDCLFLNIWVPQSTENNCKKPVMFWIHGGGYTLGSNRMPIYNGVALAARGDIIVVTTNYRLATFGFLTTNSETAPGNMGLYDILESLKWVNKNINAFGGDPNQITFAGESVGAITAAIFCTSPLTKGLFNRVIMESGGFYLQSDFNADNLVKSQQLAKALGCANDVITIYSDPVKVVDCLRDKSADEIIIAENSFRPKSNLYFLPNYGDELIPIKTKDAFILDKVPDNIDVLIGNNEAEGAHRLITFEPKESTLFGWNYPKFNKTFGESVIDIIFKDFPAKDDVKQYYLGNLAEDDYEEIREQVFTAIGDYTNFCPTQYCAESYSRAGNNVYFYFFVHRPSTTPWAEWMKVVHFEEVQFVFGNPLINPGSYTLEELNLSSKIVRMWTNFVKYGSPELPDQVGSPESSWPLYSRRQPYYVSLDICANGQYGIGPHLRNCEFFRPFFGFIQ